LNEIILRQRVDGKIQITSVKIDQRFLDENPYLKVQLKKSAEREFENRGWKIISEKGGVSYE